MSRIIFYSSMSGYYRHPDELSASSANEASAGLFWKGKGFALAGTRDALETLSRD